MKTIYPLNSLHFPYRTFISTTHLIFVAFSSKILTQMNQNSSLINHHYKNRYHPMVILLYHSQMLSAEQIQLIPRTTQKTGNVFPTMIISDLRWSKIMSKISTTTPEFPFYNNMSESTHSIYKSEFLKSKFSLNKDQHIAHIEQFMVYYNQHRYPYDHFGLTPYEVLDGHIPNKFKFREQIKTGKQNRIEANKLFNQCPVLCLKR